MPHNSSKALSENSSPIRQSQRRFRLAFPALVVKSGPVSSGCFRWRSMLCSRVMFVFVLAILLPGAVGYPPFPFVHDSRHITNSENSARNGQTNLAVWAQDHAGSLTGRQLPAFLERVACAASDRRTLPIEGRLRFIGVGSGRSSFAHQALLLVGAATWVSRGRRRSAPAWQRWSGSLHVSRNSRSARRRRCAGW